jgi:RNA-dependent RNA polymerase
LADFGRIGLVLRGRTIAISLSKHTPRSDVVQNIRRLPYQDPELNDQQLPSDIILVSTVQFGWECRDGPFSIEWQTSPPSCGIFFDDDRREIRVKMFDPPRDTLIIALRFSQIQSSSASLLSSQIPLLSFSLAQPPVFESESPNAPVLPTNARNTFYDTQPRHRLTSLGPDHEPFAPYTSLAMRLVCSDKRDLAKYKDLCRDAGMQLPKDYYVHSEARGLFTPNIQHQLRILLLELPWTVSFQVNSLIQSWLVDFTEMLALQDRIKAHVHAKGDAFTSGLLRRFANIVKALMWAEDYEDGPGSVEQCFAQAEQEFEAQPHSPSPQASDSFSCFHVNVTPTTMFLEGPYPERSNRVIRAYPEHHDHFLRVSFMDEARLQYRFDREVDGRAFIKTRVGHILKEGLGIAGRQFQFLAYSQSALKEHAVWFVSPFHDSRHGYVDASAIIKSLGSFAVTYDPKLVYCPARYGARISQAFTATDPSISVEIDEIFHENDIERNNSCFTDGVGTISPEMARAIWNELGAARRRRRHKPCPRAFQVRFQGSKGMLSVNHRLSGRAICLRPSMIKFEAPESRQIEIARAFDKPGKYYLNRPLIMILEGLGVDFDAFKRFQDYAVSEARDSTESLFRAVKMLESHGLGTSFRLPSVMLSLDNLAVHSLDDRFYHQTMECAVHHVLRELKQHARIPIPGAWTLVGVADIHEYLEEGQIFAFVKDPNSHETIYLEGPTLISRSPTIHPGDVRIVQAIGKPPSGSCFQSEPLANTVVFSVKGMLTTRSTPSRVLIYHSP